ncbi:MAG: sigma-70 family RNA polymerase sigma factor [Oscillospiraceae bacterium]|jgi:RNA polymerase sporulation-specific sigma factor|nr:sigma-70 family RNA polymerase sigma factor [Oscillospiraceae bacterium]
MATEALLKADAIAPHGQPSRNELVEGNMGLVHSCARRFQGRGADYEDLVQAGCVGLIKAVDSFDPSRGFAFSTYAVPVILGEIKRLFREGGAIKVGRSMKERARTLRQQQDALREELGRDPSISELAERTGLDLHEAAMLLSSTLPTLSLTAAQEDGDGPNEWDVPVDSPAEALSDQIALREVLGTLEERDRQLVEYRYFRGMTQTKAASRLGMTQVQVSRREKMILSKLRQYLLE